MNAGVRAIPSSVPASGCAPFTFSQALQRPFRDILLPRDLSVEATEDLCLLLARTVRSSSVMDLGTLGFARGMMVLGTERPEASAVSVFRSLSEDFYDDIEIRTRGSSARQRLTSRTLRLLAAALDKVEYGRLTDEALMKCTCSDGDFDECSILDESFGLSEEEVFETPSLCLIGVLNFLKMRYGHVPLVRNGPRSRTSRPS